MKRKLYFTLLLSAVLLFTGCASSISIGPKNTSKFVTEDVIRGMDLETFIHRFGRPYKRDFYHSKDGVLHEKLYYKESIYVNRWITLNSVFEFEDSILVSQMSDEEDPYQSDYIYID